EVPPGAGVCPRDGTVILSSFMARDDEDTQIEVLRDVWGSEPPSRGRNAPFAWGEEPPPRSQAGDSQESSAPSPVWGDEPPTRDPLIGMKLGEYELRSRIGVGGMGFVYDGIQPLIGKRVAVKVLRPELAQAPEQVARLLAEARAVNAIRHRGIIDIFGFGQVPDGRQYIVMEFLDGQPLDAYLAEKARLPPTEALSILDEVLAALGAAHGAGVVHRDLKPSNIFLVREPGGTRYVKLLDFGLAKQGQSGAAARTAQTRTDMVVGTPEYMAPEQARGQAVGPMTDLYAMGVVTFEMVTGRLPFIGTSPVDLLMKHVDARPPRPSEFVPELPPALDAFILQMLTKDPEARPSSADALRQQLHRLRRTMLRPTRAQAAAAAANGAATRAPTPVPSPITAPVSSPLLEAAPAAASPISAPAVPAVALDSSEHATAPNPILRAEDAGSRMPTTQVPSLPGGLSAAEARAVGGRSPLRRLVPILLAAAALLAAVGVLLFRDSGPEPTDDKPPGVVLQPETPTTPQPPPSNPVVAQPPPGTPDPNPNPANPPVPTVSPETPKPPDTVAQPETPKPPSGKNPHRPGGPRFPGQQDLMTSVDRLERDMNGLIQSGLIKKEDEQSARNMFARIRKEAKAANSTEDGRKVEKVMALFEKTYLKR
ncbi:serine/threonine-protein kinase, partial [Hyalangium sp.]|uniref:serine/threonine-protein kinase n=1 Tax=Hyalangium sp. TaxID=2028555 RepID=UPI0039C893ED